MASEAMFGQSCGGGLCMMVWCNVPPDAVANLTISPFVLLGFAFKCHSNFWSRDTQL